MRGGSEAGQGLGSPRASGGQWRGQGRQRVSSQGGLGPRSQITMTLGKDTARIQPSLCDPLRQVCRRLPLLFPKAPGGPLQGGRTRPMVSLSVNLPGAGSCSTHRETEAMPTALPPTKPHTGQCGRGVGDKPSLCGYPAPGVRSGKRGGPPHPAPDVPGPQLPAPPPSPCPSCSWTPNGPSPTCLSLSFPCPPPAGAAGGQAGRRPACPAQWHGHSPSSNSGPPGPEAQCSQSPR